MADNWLKVGEEAEFAQGLRVVNVNGRKVVIGKLDGRLYAFDALCPHAGGPMELAECEGTIVSCPLHSWRFDLSEQGKELHGYRGLSVKKVTAQDGSVYVAE